MSNSVGKRHGNQSKYNKQILRKPWKVNKWVKLEIAVQIVSEIVKSPRASWHFSWNPEDKNSAMKRKSWECVFEAGGKGHKDSEAQKSMTYSRRRLAFKEMESWLSLGANLILEYLRLNQGQRNRTADKQDVLEGVRDRHTFPTWFLQWWYGFADAGLNSNKVRPCTLYKKNVIS